MIKLTKSEYRVYELIVKGLNDYETSRALYISDLTVKCHLRSIYKKFKVKNRIELRQSKLKAVRAPIGEGGFTNAEKRARKRPTS